jgi:type IV pilus assembly protein PilC
MQESRMQEWVWEARARSGETKKGVMEAENEAAVQKRLTAQNLTPVKVKKKPRDIEIHIGAPVSQQELVIFTRQFATMIDAGLPLVQCLEILANTGENKYFQRVLRDVKGNVEQGATFSESLKRHGNVFDALYVNLVAAGETGGILDTILTRLAVYIEKRVKLVGQVRKALVYPTAVMVIAVVVLIILLAYVIPSFQNMFAEFGAGDELPALTEWVISLSEGFLHYWYVFAAVIAGTFFGVTYSYRTKGGRVFWDRFLLNLPVIGGVLRKIAVARFTRTLGTLLSSGVPILDALEIVGKASGNVIIEDAIIRTSDRIREGRTMAEPLGETNVFPAMVVQMIGVGEQTGALDQMLNKIADFYDEEVDLAVASMTSLIEPVMMVVVGGMVGTLLIAMYLPIFDIAGKIQAE